MSNHTDVLLHTSRSDLHTDCKNCFGLCCVALPFAASADFALNKDGGRPCPNLQDDYHCGIHQQLRQKGFRGCAVYECFGAGQKVSQVLFKGKDWRKAPETAKQMFEVFPIVQQLHEMLLYLAEALSLKAAKPIYKELRCLFDETEQLTQMKPNAIIELDVSAHRAKVNHWLLHTSELVRAEATSQWKNSQKPKRRKGVGRGADLIGARLRKANLMGTDLRGALLIAADLREADLRATDLIGADLRDADLSGADLRGSIFLTQAQINAAKGSLNTKLPPTLIHPPHWFASSP